MEMIPMMINSLRRLLASGESAFFIVIQFLLLTFSIPSTVERPRLAMDAGVPS
jgi:hypothetical protein